MKQSITAWCLLYKDQKVWDVIDLYSTQRECIERKNRRPDEYRDCKLFKVRITRIE